MQSCFFYPPKKLRSPWFFFLFFFLPFSFDFVSPQLLLWWKSVIWKLLIICWVLVVRNTWPFKGRASRDIIHHKAAWGSSSSPWAQDSERHLTAAFTASRGTLMLLLEELFTIVGTSNQQIKTGSEFKIMARRSTTPSRKSFFFATTNRFHQCPKLIFHFHSSTSFHLWHFFTHYTQFMRPAFSSNSRGYTWYCVTGAEGRCTIIMQLPALVFCLLSTEPSLRGHNTHHRYVVFYHCHF